jgi:hypothetical protein
MYRLSVIVNYSGQDGKTIYATLVSSPSPYLWETSWTGGSGVLSGGTVTFDMEPFMTGTYRLYMALDVNGNWAGTPDGADLVALSIPVGLIAVEDNQLTENNQLTVDQSVFQPVKAAITVNHSIVTYKWVYVTIVADNQPCDSSALADLWRYFTSSSLDFYFWGIPDGIYDVCAYFDMDNDGSPTAGDFSAEGINLTIPPGMVIINETDFTTL